MKQNNSDVFRALLVRDPWVSLILSAQKTWEMRKQRTLVRGTIALIRIGSGLVVGTADLVDSLGPLSRGDLAASSDRHGLDSAAQEWAIAEGYLVPWVLLNARPLARPLPYAHNNQQMWVLLADIVAAGIREQGHTLGSGSV